ncbi:MAG: hypothetical protein E7238_00140 [Sarcina sp.]|nr:hypothetical protein [Sarcina sp.]
MMDFKALLTKIVESLVISEKSLEVSTALSSTNMHVCRLVKKGTTVRAYIAIGYSDGTTTIPTGTTMFTVPDGFRPPVDITRPACGALTNQRPCLAHFTIKDDGSIVQNTSSTMTMMYGAVEWTIQ